MNESLLGNKLKKITAMVVEKLSVRSILETRGATTTLTSMMKTSMPSYLANCCGEILDSEFTHNFKRCKCGRSYVDGGDSYSRVGFTPGDEPPLFLGTRFCSTSYADDVPSAIQSVRDYTFQAKQSWLRGPFNNAAETWAKICGVTLTEIGGAFGRANILGEVVERVHGDGYPFDGPLNKLAHAWSVPRGWTHFDADEFWVLAGGDTGGIEIDTIALHEWGHILRLGHSDNPDSVMFPYYASGLRWALHETDIAAAVEVWGPAEAPRFTVDSKVPIDLPANKWGSGHQFMFHQQATGQYELRFEEIGGELMIVGVLGRASDIPEELDG